MTSARAGGHDGSVPARRRLSVSARRDELTAAALRVMSRRSPDEVSIDDIAREAGASRALVYHYFGSKQELYVTALRSAAAELTDRVTPPAVGTPGERLRAAVHGFVAFADEHAAGFVALLHGSPAYGSGEVTELVHGVRTAVLDLLLTGLPVTGTDPTLRLTLRGWIAAAETEVLDWLEHRDIDEGTVEGLLVDQLAALLTTVPGVPAGIIDS